MNGIIRVFPRKNSYTPVDNYVFYGLPPLAPFIPEHREVHICCVFSWDKAECEELAFQWESRTNKPVRLGGPAYGSPSEDFIQGMYMKPNIIFTTRGCNNQCSWCIVPKLEGRLKELPVCQGNIIQDNNFLQASKAHKNKVFDMLKTQRGICFKGGLDADLVDEHFVRGITNLRISELWLACDTDSALPGFLKAVEKLKADGWGPGGRCKDTKIHCYTLVAQTGDGTARSKAACMEKAEARLRTIYEAGAMPFAQLYRAYTDSKTDYDDDWNKWARMWQRAPATIKHMERGTEYWEF